MPTPDWAKCHVEIYEAPGWLDDCFRSNLWTKFQSSASESFTNAGDVSGDYATMTVTEGATPLGCGWRKDISGLSLSTSTYPVARFRLRGRGTDPYYKVEVEYADASMTTSGWVSAPEDMNPVTLNLALGKTVKYVKLYAKSNTGNQTAYIDYDYAAIIKQPPLIPAEVEEADIDLQTTRAVGGFRLVILNDTLLGVTDRRYSFDEASGSKAYDKSMNKGHGTLSNASWDSGGKHGACLYFSAASSAKVSTGSKPTIAATGALTIAFWVKALSGATGVIVGVGKTIGADWNRIQLNFQVTDKVRLYVKDDSANIRQYTSVKTIADNQWHQIVGIVDPSNDKIDIYVDGEYDGGATGALGTITENAQDFTVGCLNSQSGYTNYMSGYVDEVAFYSRALKAEEIYRLFKQDPLSGAARAGPGNIVMLYLAANSENQVYKIVAGRVIDREARGDPDNPVLELAGEDLGEILHERTFTREYASATQISGIVDNVLDDSAPELFTNIDATNRALVNNFKEENVWSLLQKLAETASFASGESGANFYVDPGGALRFKKYGAFNCPLAVSDGSDGNLANILDVSVKETMKGNPRLVNDVKVIVFEEEAQPRDEDSWTESAGGWSSPDPTDEGYPQSDEGDKQSGTASVKFQTTNPGWQYRMRLDVSDTDIGGFDAFKFYMKYGAGLSIDYFSVKIQKSGWWEGDYRDKTFISPPGAGAWHEMTINIADMGVYGNPGYIINNIQIKAEHSSQIGTGGFLIDKLRFVRNEKAGTASDATSQANYGKRTHTAIDKTVTDTDYAVCVAGNILEHRKNPLVTVQARVPGRAQLGYRPPQIVTVTSLKDGMNGRQFQITRARHRYRTSEGYTCELEMVAARKPDGTYEPKVAPASVDLSSVLAEMQRRQYEDQLNALRTAWE